MDTFDLKKYLSNNPLLNEIKINPPGDRKLTDDQIENLPVLDLTIGKYDVSKGRIGKQVSPNSLNISDATRNRALLIFDKLGIKPEKAWIAYQTYINQQGERKVGSGKSTFIMSSYNDEPILIAQTQTDSPMAGQIYIYSKYFKSGKALRLPDGQGGHIDTSDLYADKNATKNQILRALKINTPESFIKLNLPSNLKDNNKIFINGPFSDDIDSDGTYEEYTKKFDSLIEDLIKLNPQIDPELFIKDEGGIQVDVADILDREYPNGVNLYEFYKIYFNRLWSNLIYNPNKYSEDELEIRDNYYDYNRSDEFADNAMNGKWLVVPDVTA
jgi:hypothetical protein